MSETGVVKFDCEQVAIELAPFPEFDELAFCRSELRKRGLIGVDANGIGFGNLSTRICLTSDFYITGSGTGGLPQLQLRDLARVTGWDFPRNWLRCEGQTIASSESLTHAAIYAGEPGVRAIAHGHSATIWRHLLSNGISTSPEVEYGTPAMAEEVQRLFRETDVMQRGIFAMAGHEDGIVAFGANFASIVTKIAEADQAF